MSQPGGICAGVKRQVIPRPAASIRLGLVKKGKATTVTSQIVTAFDIWFPKDERQRVKRGFAHRFLHRGGS